MNKGVYIGIDTSNYTTSLALCDEAGQVTANLKAPLPVKEGERGLRQSDAVFAHVRNLPPLMEQLQALLHPTDAQPPRVLGVGYSATPRRAEGSYMPCFRAGEVAAKALCAATGAALVTTSHQEGHVMAALYSADAIAALSDTPFVAFHVSGGTTDMLMVRPSEQGFDIELLGTSLDLHAGQAVDRIGVAMGLSFPCGRELEELAANCTEKVPKPRICVKGMNCHLSGLENLALTLYKDTQDKALVAAYTLDFIADTLIAMSREVRAAYPDIPLLFAGGVMSNRRIQQAIGRKFKAYFAEPAFSADNAAGVALLCRRQLTK
ncbi:MAG: peptidase M22 [Clostridia bacterium]|nr:peptidase M22 [Clostridia bacterium]